MKIYLLKKKDWLYFLGIFIAGLALIFIMHYLIPEKFRFPIATIFFIGLFSTFYFLVNPKHFFELTLALWIILIPAILLVVVLFHVIISFDIIQSKIIFKILFSIAMTIAESFIGGIIFNLYKRIKS